jgi:L-lactate dehydrogenase complex protein LldG
VVEDPEMSGDREAMLARIRAAIAGGRAKSEAEPDPAYRLVDESPREEIVARFVEYAADYRADVKRVPPESAGAAITETLRARGVRRLVIPADLPTEWIPEGVEVLSDAAVLSHAVLDASDGVLTGCALAIAQTGTLVLDGGVGQGRRALTLLPDYHLCVVRADQVVGLMPEAIARLSEAVVERRQPVTFVSGPSATSDIELNRVEGVHGPRVLDIIVLG